MDTTEQISIEPKYLNYLDDLRSSGRVNMFGAAGPLRETFGLDAKEAKRIHQYWMKSFHERHPEPENHPPAEYIVVIAGGYQTHWLYRGVEGKPPYEQPSMCGRRPGKTLVQWTQLPDNQAVTCHRCQGRKSRAIGGAVSEEAKRQKL
jgi:hypothetical protein